jgi:hypothetical protein
MSGPWKGDQGCIVQPSAISTEETIREGREAWQRLTKGRSRQDWWAVGRVFELARKEAMRTAHSNVPQGPRYRNEYRLWLEVNELKDLSEFAKKNKAVVSHLIKCLENLPAIETWLATLPLNKQMVFNHPTVILRNWQAKWPGAPKGPSPMARLKDENVRLKSEIESGGDQWRIDDSAKAIARVEEEKLAALSDSKFDEVLKEMRKLRRSRKR